MPQPTHRREVILKYSQGEGNVLTLCHGAIQRDLEGLVDLSVTFSPRKMNLYLVMEDWRRKLGQGLISLGGNTVSPKQSGNSDPENRSH
jgi:hypothetical protein